MSLILYDTPSLIIRRVFATLKWIKLSKRELNEDQTKEYMIKHLFDRLKALRKYVKKYSGSSPDEIFCRDCSPDKNMEA